MLESDQAIMFNLSHAADVALFAFARETDLGVDLESAAVLLDPESVVQRCMSKRERRLLHRVPPEKRDEAILATWVRKEAVAKGSGEGLGLPLVEIGTRPGVPASGEPVIVRSSRRDKWFVWDLPVGGGAAALASRRREISIKLFDHPGTVIDLTQSDPRPSKDASVSLTP
jgi:4'-phosphopantetheinyl transferase